MKYSNIHIKVTPRRGCNIGNVCSDIKDLSEDIEQEIAFEFNGVAISTEKSINEMILYYNTAR